MLVEHEFKWTEHFKWTVHAVLIFRHRGLLNINKKRISIWRNDDWAAASVLHADVWYSRLAYKSRDGTGGRVSAFCRLKPESGRFVRIQLCWADCEGLPANTNTRGGSQIHPPALWSPGGTSPVTHCNRLSWPSWRREGRGARSPNSIYSFLDSQVSVFFLFPVTHSLCSVFSFKDWDAERFRPGLWAPSPWRQRY